MHLAVRLLFALAALAAAGAAFAHPGIHGHSHPHLGVDLLLAIVAGGTWGMLYSMGALGGTAPRQRSAFARAGGAAIGLVGGWLLLSA